MPLHQAQLQGDLSWISWTFKRYITIKVLAQHYPIMTNFARKKIMVGRKARSSSGFHQKVIFIDPLLMNKGVEELAKEKVLENNLHYKMFVKSNTSSVRLLLVCLYKS